MHTDLRWWIGVLGVHFLSDWVTVCDSSFEDGIGWCTHCTVYIAVALSESRHGMWTFNGSGSTVSDARDILIHAIDSGWFHVVYPRLRKDLCRSFVCVSCPDLR